MTKSDDYLWDRSGEPDPEVARLEALLSPLRHEAPLDELRLRRRNRTPLFVIGVAMAAMLALVVWWRWPGDDAPQLACSGTAGFAFTAKTGTVACGGANVAKGVLPVGTTLDTGAHEAELAIADIGRADLGVDTRVRLDRTSAKWHQLFLEQGHMHALVTTRVPRIFAVATPSTNVTDLGCEYTLDIDSTGAGTLHVLSGKVELENGTKLVVAQRGTHMRLLAGRRPSVPVSDRAGPEISAAIRDFEANVPGSLDRVLAAAQVVDAITLSTLADLVPAEQKRTVLERLAQLVPPPQEVTVDEALAESAFYEMWMDEVVLVHLGASAPAPSAPTRR